VQIDKQQEKTAEVSNKAIFSTENCPFSQKMLLNVNDDAKFPKFDTNHRPNQFQVDGATSTRM